MKYITPFIILGLIAPIFAFAQQDDQFEISAWIPYWRAEKGTASITPHIDSFTEVNPFIYTVKEDGTLYEADGLAGKEWLRLRKQANDHGVKYIPTVMWAGSDAIHRVLSDPELRANHIRSIARNVYQYGVDGIDIDYEAKYAKTRPYFSQFLKELKVAIGYDKWIMCTIESRTPLDSIYGEPSKIPDDIEYSNDFVEINKYCDRVRLMAYDQGRYDQKLNKENEHPYTPVADVDWVEKVVRLALEDIDADKLVIGIPTYGYEYDHFQNPSGTMGYSRLWSFNPGYATEIAERLNIQIERSGGGEAQFTFPASQSLESIPLPNATRIVTWSDAKAIKQKIELARELGVRGIAIFKVDGGEDSGLYSVIAPHVGSAVIVAQKTPDVQLAQEAEATQQTASAIGAFVNATQETTKAALVDIPDVDLEEGDITESVRDLQKLLNHHGFTIANSGPGSVGSETNIFGSLTEAALIRFQKAHNISPAVGYFGPITRSMMRNL